MKYFLTIVLISVAMCNCRNATVVNDVLKDSTTGKIEIYDKAALSLIDSNAAIDIIASGYTWSEGPVWLSAKRALLFTDVPENKIYMWKEGEAAKVFLMPSGYAGSVKRIGGEDGANGLALDNNDSLLLCQSGNRQVARLRASYDDAKPAFEVLAANYNGKKFNSPNDLAVSRNNTIYFTDPVYGLPQRENDSTRELKFEGVYKISPGKKITLLIDSIPRPNGIALSNDEKTLYVASSDSVHSRWYTYTLDANGNIQSGKVLFDATALKANANVHQGCDGFKIDKHGNIFGAGPDGVSIISPEGKRLALIKIYKRRVSNCAFDETKNTLFITAKDVVLKMKLRNN